MLVPAAEVPHGSIVRLQDPNLNNIVGLVVQHPKPWLVVLAGSRADGLKKHPAGSHLELAWMSFSHDYVPGHYTIIYSPERPDD